jgi:DNA-binding transcriptional regulator YiaG
MVQKLERKRQSSFVFEGFGFPVVLLNVPMVRSLGVWTPDIDYRKLTRIVLRQLALHPARLTGHEIRFIRHSMDMTLEEFAHRFGVTHPAVVQWEQCGAKPTRMAWALEKDIRLQIIKSQLTPSASRFAQAYEELAEERPRKATPVRVGDLDPAGHR